jgi:hypothetical protein
MDTGQDNSTCTEELQALSLIIFGEPASKANSRRVVKFGNMSRLIKSQKALNYSDAFKQQCTPLAKLMSGDIRMTLHIYYASRRPDLDESLILDLLQGVVYLNDRQVKERHVFWGLDKENPRAEMLIEQIPPVYTEKKPARRRAKRE